MAQRINPQSLLQLRIELKHTDPLIWRTVLVPDTLTLVQLHTVIQETMGWLGGHLHEFEIGGMRYGTVDPQWDHDPPLIDERRKRLVNVLGPAKRFLYLYDFGDHWLHQIILEHRLPLRTAQRYAMCLAGENACPPEDVGGVPGFYEFLEAIADPAHEEHDSMLEWCGGSYHPQNLDIDLINTNLKRNKGLRIMFIGNSSI